MSIVARLSFVLVLALGVLGLTPAALAQPTNDQIARRGLAQMAANTDRIVAQIQQTTRRGNGGLIAADRNGADDAAITAQGEQVKGRITSQKDAGVARITQIRDRVVADLTAGTADQALIDRVNNAATAAINRLNQAAINNSGRVDSTVDRLTD